MKDPELRHAVKSDVNDSRIFIVFVFTSSHLKTKQNEGLIKDERHKHLKIILKTFQVFSLSLVLWCHMRVK